ncbi:MAG: hypothetical protein ABMA64_10990 [Myxococcota bacterium]
MATDRLQAQLDQIRALRDDPTSPASTAALRAALAKHPSHVVALAARHVAEFGLRELVDDLVKAYARLAPGLAKTDAGCVGKVALVEALSALDHPDETPLLHAVHHVQLEKAWGPPVDTAAGLRGKALMALVGLGHPDTPLWIGEMLADPDPRARSAAAQCAAAWGDPVVGQALLRLRVRAGEVDGEVLADLFEAMLALGGAAAVDHVARQLVDDGVKSESAALALGSSRSERALPALVRWWTEVPGARRVALVAIGLLRVPAALEFLLERVATDGRLDALDALKAMAAFVHDPKVVGRIREVARSAGLEGELDGLG